ARPENLPAASYSLVTQVESKGVYSFCMCPGGIICPAATAEGEVVVNGWSPSKRNSAYANSGMVVEVSLEDLPKDLQHSMGAMAYQKEIEQRAFVAGGGKQVAPAQRLTDFLAGKVSQDLPDCSYLPGLNPVSLKEVLPKRIGMRLQRGLAHFGKRLRGYISEEAVVVGVESRTSSPVRIPRDQESLMHPEVAGLFPCGEGAGYAGGIMSAAIDGIRVSRAVKLILE
ncbi:MAG: FAD-dependent protein, partial [Bacteroidota bacterium]